MPYLYTPHHHLVLDPLLANRRCKHTEKKDLPKKASEIFKDTEDGFTTEYAEDSEVTEIK